MASKMDLQDVLVFVEKLVEEDNQEKILLGPGYRKAFSVHGVSLQMDSSFLIFHSGMMYKSAN